MPNIYLTQAEFDAIEFCKGVAQAAHEASDSESFQQEYEAAQVGIKNLTKKFYKAKRKEYLP